MCDAQYANSNILTIMLIDGHGCPTDPSIMSNIIQKDSDSIHLEAPFDAFKFPSSEIVVVSNIFF